MSADAEIAAIKARLDALENASGLYATDKEIDGKYGDPQIKFSPRGWNGKNYVGKKMSETEPAFLDLVAEANAYSAAHPKDPKYVKYNLADASRARSWA